MCKLTGECTVAEQGRIDRKKYKKGQSGVKQGWSAHFLTELVPDHYTLFYLLI